MGWLEEKPGEKWKENELAKAKTAPDRLSASALFHLLLAQPSPSGDITFM